MIFVIHISISVLTIPDTFIKNIVLCYVTVEVATLLTGLLPDEGAVTPAGKYLITCNLLIIIEIILKTRRRRVVLDFPW